jgi:hypothetical protein
MGFLDNSGDIILDAVLTDLGRKRMADGEFRITKFALGDDEIDYSLYNANHPSGTAYYDLEILQSPVMEAATRQASSIKYGLLSITRTDLVYMPTLEVNEKLEGKSLVKEGSMYYLAANAATHENLLNNNANKANRFLQPNSNSPTYAIVVESGIASNERQPTLENRNAAIVQTGLLDTNFEIKFDNRFVAGARTLVGGKLANDSSNNLEMRLDTFAAQSGVSSLDFIENYSTAMARGIPNEIAKRGDGTSTSGNNFSQFQGPRGGVTAMTFSPSLEINAEGTAVPAYYTLYGRAGQSASSLGLGGSDTYDTIDTTIYVRGMASSAQLQIPLRIIRLAS